MKTTRISLAALSMVVGALLSVNGYADEAAVPVAEAAEAAVPVAEAAEAAVPVAEAVQADASGNEGVSVLIDKTIKVMTADVDEMANAVFEANQAQIPAEEVAAAKKDIRKNVIEQLTLQALLLRECDKADVKVSEEERDALFSQMTGGEKTFEEVAEEAGMPVEKFRDIIMKNIRIEKLLTSKTEALPVPSEEDAKARFDEVVAANPEAIQTPASLEASHILISVDAEADDVEAVDAAAKKKMEEVRQKLLDGADFAEMAAEYSDCPSKANGGSLGQFGQGQMVKPFEDAAFAQEVGKIGDVVKTSFGYHVIRVDEKHEGGTITFDDVKEDIMKSLEREKTGTFQRDYLTGLRQGAQIENLEKPVVSEPVQAPRELPEWAQ